MCVCEMLMNSSRIVSLHWPLINFSIPSPSSRPEHKRLFDA